MQCLSAFTENPSFDAWCVPLQSSWHERFLQPKGKASVPHQSTESSTYLGSSGVGSKNGAKSSLPWCVPATKKSKVTAMKFGESNSILHTHYWILKNPIKQCWSCQVFRTHMVSKLLCTAFWGRISGCITTVTYSETLQRFPLSSCYPQRRYKPNPLRFSTTLWFRRMQVILLPWAKDFLSSSLQSMGTGSQSEPTDLC